MKIAHASILTGFGPTSIGTKVLAHNKFEAYLTNAIKDYTFPENGQGFIHLPKEAYGTVSAGVASRLQLGRDDQFVPRFYRGRYDLYAKREFAARVEGLACVVYTKSAYFADPDVDEHEKAQINREQATHVLVAVLAFAGPKAPLPPWTFIHNVAGGNNAFKPATYIDAAAIVTSGIGVRDNGDYLEAVKSDIRLLHKVVTDAKETEDYWSKWIVVAD